MPTLNSVGAAAKSSGMAGAAVGAGIEAVSSIYDVLNGDKEVEDAVVDVAAAGVKGGVVGAASAAASSVAAGAAGTAITAAAGTTVGAAVAGTAIGGLAVAAAPVAIGFGVACAVGSFLSDLFD